MPTRLLRSSACFVVLLLSALAAGCSAEASRPNVLVIVIDTLRQDHLATYGYPRQTAPTLSRLAERGATFNALSTSSWTKPGSASILTGLYPVRHQAMGRTDRLSDEVVTLAERMRGSGYHTIGISANGYVSESYNMQQGFDDFVFVRQNEGGSDAETVTARLLRFLPPSRSPFFAYVQYIDPHSPLEPPVTWRGRPLPNRLRERRGVRVDQLDPFTHLDRDPELMKDLNDLYDGEIRHTDDSIGHLLAELSARGLLENTIVVVTSDHGEEFGDHGRLSHGQTLYEEVTRVPLIITGPGIRPGRRAGNVSVIDIAPTIADLCGIRVHRQPMDGSTLAPSLRNGAPLDPERPLLLHLDMDEVGTGHHAALALVKGRFKLLLASSPYEQGLFDLATDPHEHDGSLGAAGGRDRALDAELVQTYERLARRAFERQVADPSHNVLASLKALGYLGAGSADQAEPRTIPLEIGPASLVRNGPLGWEGADPSPCLELSQRSADRQLLAGWYFRESTGRWSSGTATAVVGSRDATRVVVRGANHGPNEVELRVSADGTEIGRRDLKRGPFEFSFPFEPRSGKAVIEASASPTFHPSDHGRADRRTLGLFFSLLCATGDGPRGRDAATAASSPAPAAAVQTPASRPARTLEVG